MSDDGSFVWVNRSAGQGPRMIDIEDGPGAGRASLLVAGVSVGDHVRPPAEVGGGEFPVARVGVLACPKCRDGHEALIYILGGTDIVVIECGRVGFVWCRAQL